MAEIPYLKVVHSKGNSTVGDCGICAVGSFTSQTYEDVVSRADQLGFKWKKGLWGTQMVALAASFGTTFKKRRKYDIETATGMLMVNICEREPGRKPKRIDHVVVLDDGRIIDCDGSIWRIDAFLSHYEAKVGELLELCD
jgi:hypothetical protein